MNTTTVQITVTINVDPSGDTDRDTYTVVADGQELTHGWGDLDLYDAAGKVQNALLREREARTAARKAEDARNWVTCGVCLGDGMPDGFTCDHCDGTGLVVEDAPTRP